MAASTVTDPVLLRSRLDSLRAEHAALKQRGLQLNIARGKPSEEQLALSDAILSLPGPGDWKTEAGEDVRNYGGDPQGVPELRALMSPILDLPASQIVAGGNSSLAMMHDCLVWALLKGVPGSTEPWSRVEKPAFICPAPGYEKHHTMCVEYGIELLPVAVTPTGPDMDAVEALAADPRVKGIWCVPTYANPTGETYSDETARRLAAMKTGAPDFRLFWDDAYLVHHLSGNGVTRTNIVALCAAAGHPDRAFVFASTSKITLASAGVGFFASSPANVAWYLARDGKRGVGPDKLNQLRHVRFLKDADGLRDHMEKQRALLAPKFAAVLDGLSRRLAGTGVASWSNPLGGYFISIEALPGTARRAVELAQEAGVTLTVAGSTWPHGKDPQDSNIRIAPSYAPLADVKAAADIIGLSILLAAAETLLTNNARNKVAE
ncbi:aminotransferase class I/II-fold pyridoxal phosphate-dependent enzyme [Bosea sp. F3-2]|uniref:aminotransferase class I/II-fold pyridoxal phosphate-dependent enzyme n=1 Tax=Bosea sp. F3-2 TaxID=2599640 RepID=UPI0020BE9BD3|nr:aminotransferase class I/II-fold pyridoxal phosphate-dependent enzyme [Bosea sp. F3-2]